MGEFDAEDGSFAEQEKNEDELVLEEAPQKKVLSSAELRAKADKEDEARLMAQEERELKQLEDLKKNSPLKIKIEKQDDYVLITLTNSFQYDSVKYFQFMMKYEVMKPYMDIIENYIINLKEVGMLDFAGMRELVQFQVTLKRRNKKMYMAEVSDIIMKNITAQGLDKTFSIKSSVKNVLVDLGLIKKKAFDVSFLNPFIDAAMKVFEVQCFTKANPEPVIILKPSEMPPADISGIIGIVSDSFTGTITIHFKKDVYEKIGTKMMNSEFTDKSAQFLDAVGELSNMILGQAKAKLNQMGYNIQQALPSVSYGKDQMIKTLSGSPSLLVPFKTEFGMFHVQITTKVK